MSRFVCGLILVGLGIIGLYASALVGATVCFLAGIFTLAEGVDP